jgi:hypothetical protein
MISRVLLAVFFLVAAFSASAQVTNLGPTAVRSGTSFVVNYASDGTVMASSARSVVAGATGEFLIRDMFNAAGPAGNLGLTAQRTVSGAAAARAIVGQAAKGFVPVAIGIAAYDLMQAYRVRATASGGLEVDPGVATSPQTSWKATFPSGSPSAGSAAAAIQAGHQSRTSSSFIPLECLTDTLAYSNGGTSASMRCNYRTAAAPNGYIDYFQYAASSSTVQGCTAQIDALTGVSYVPGVGGDGKCLTGRYDPITADNAATRIAAGMTVAAVKDYIMSPGAQASPIPTIGTTTVTGPATQVGTATTSTTTTSTGSTTSTVTPTYNYTYGGNTVTYNTVNSTVTNTTNGGTTTTTTESKPQSETDTQCKLYPNSLGCLSLGEAPDSPITPVQKSVTVGQESISLPSGCPADIAVPGGRVLSFATACDAAQKMAPLVIAAGVLSALLIAVAAIRSP